MGRRRPDEDAGSLDSLLDTMTNVVGILIILMIVTQLGVTDAVKRILRAGDAAAVEVTPEALTQAETKRAELEKLIAGLREQWAGLETSKPGDVAAVADVAGLIEKLKAQMAEAAQAKTDSKKLESEVAERKKKADELAKQYAALSKQLAELKARLAKAPGRTAPPAKIVTLPDPRSAPEGATPLLMIVRDGRVTPANEDDLRKVVETTMKRLRITPNEAGLIDCDKLVGAINKGKIGDRYWRVTLEIRSHRPYIVPQRRDTAGETIEQISQPSSTYMRMVRLAKLKNQYLRFYVFSDSYDTYLEARRLAGEADVAAGWAAFDKGYVWRIWMPGQVYCIGKPAPPPAKPKPPVDPNAPPPKPKPKPLPKEDID